MHRSVHPPGRGAPCAGFAMMGTLLFAMLSAIVLMTGCHSAPMRDARPSGATLPALAREGVPAPSTWPPIAPFDEQFYVQTADCDDGTN